MTPRMHGPTERTGERGAALIFTIVALAVVTVMGLAVTSLGVSSTYMAVQEGQTRQALAIADAGLEHGKSLVLRPEFFSMNPFLQRGDGVGCSFDELGAAVAGPLPPGYPTAAADFVPAAGRAFGGGTYFVALCDNHATESAMATPDVNPAADVDGRVLLRSVGVLPQGGRSAVEVMLAATSMPAVIVNGHLRLNGNPTITGTGGAVHANGTVENSGNPCAHAYYSSTNEILPLSGGNAQGGAGCTVAARDYRPYVQPINIPVLAPSAYRNLANYHLTSTGQMRAGYNGMVIPSGNWNFQSSNQTWRITSGSPPPGTYYVEANVEMSGGGTAASPLLLTMLVEGSFRVTGNPTLGPAQTLQFLGGVVVIAGRDIDLGSSYSSTGNTGLYYARQQLNVAGNPTMNGQLIAANYCEVGTFTRDCRDLGYPNVNSGNPNQNPVQLDATGRMTISGNPTVNYNGNGAQTFMPVSWRECRGDWAGVNPGTACGTP